MSDPSTPQTTPKPSAEWIADCMRWRGKVLTGPCAHWCFDWDELPVDATTPEFSCCTCYTDAEKTAGGARG